MGKNEGNDQVVARLPPKARWLIWFCTALAALLVSSMLLHRPAQIPGPPGWSTLIVVTALTLLSSRFKFDYNHIGIAPTLAAETAALVLLGPWLSTWVVLAAILQDSWQNRARVKWFQILFNVAHTVISFSIGAWLFNWLTNGTYLFDFQSPLYISAILLSMMIYFGLSGLLTATVVSFARNSSWLGSIIQLVDGGYLFNLWLIPLGVAGAALATTNPYLIFTLILPIIAIHRMGETKSRLVLETRATLETIARLVDKRDRYTHQHSQRVAHFATLIGQQLALSPRQLDILRRGCLIHDIGKMALSDQVLKGSGRLTQAQWEEIKSHPDIGYELIRDLEPYQDYTLIVRHHHERFDGTGYPHGLRGESIPLLARIAAVADSYDAMTSNRSYRGALSKETALAELVQGQRSQFDPIVVEAALKVLPDAPTGATVSLNANTPAILSAE